MEENGRARLANSIKREGTFPRCLTITGDRTFDLNRKRDHPAEHAYGRFAHSFEIPADARPAKVSAAFKKVVLTVHPARSSCAPVISLLAILEAIILLQANGSLRS